MKKFSHLHVPDQWNQYFTKYPQGYTILEALLNWVAQVDNLTDNINDWNVYLDGFVQSFDKDLQGQVTEILNDWQESGVLGELLTNKADSQYETITFNIPTDYPDLQTAIDHLSRRKVKNGVIINLNLEARYEITTPLILSNGDYGHFRITSTDSQVFLSLNFPKTNAFTFRNCRAPILATLINAQGKCVNGIKLEKVSTMVIEENCGLTHAGTSCLYVGEGSTAHAKNTVFTYASQDGGPEETGGSGIVAWGGMAFVEGADVSHSKTYGVQGAHNGRVSFRQGKALDVGRYCVRGTNGALIDVRDAHLTGAQFYGIYAYGAAIINGRGVIIENCQGSGVLATQASNLDIRDSLIQNNEGNGIHCSGATSINAYYAKIYDNQGHGVQVSRQGTVDLYGADIQRSGLNGLRVSSGGRVTIQGGKVQNSTNTDIWHDEGTFIDCRNARTTSSTDARIQEADTNETTFNTLSIRGAIFS